MLVSHNRGFQILYAELNPGVNSTGKIIGNNQYLFCFMKGMLFIINHMYSKPDLNYLFVNLCALAPLWPIFLMPPGHEDTREHKVFNKSERFKFRFVE